MMHYETICDNYPNRVSVMDLGFSLGGSKNKICTVPSVIELHFATFWLLRFFCLVTWWCILNKSSLDHVFLNEDISYIFCLEIGAFLMHHVLNQILLSEISVVDISSSFCKNIFWLLIIFNMLFFMFKGNCLISEAKASLLLNLGVTFHFF